MQPPYQLRRTFDEVRYRQAMRHAQGPQWGGAATGGGVPVADGDRLLCDPFMPACLSVDWALPRTTLPHPLGQESHAACPPTR